MEGSKYTGFATGAGRCERHLKFVRTDWRIGLRGSRAVLVYQIRRYLLASNDDSIGSDLLKLSSVSKRRSQSIKSFTLTKSQWLRRQIDNQYLNPPRSVLYSRFMLAKKRRD